MEEQRIAKAHKLVVNNRKTSMVTGVLDVLSFDLNEILLETEQGMLMVKGTDLHVNRLSVEKGEVDLSGNIDSIAYSSSTAQTGKPAKASVKVKPGDIIEIQFGTRNVKVEVLALQDTTKKEEAKELFKYL